MRKNIWVILRGYKILHGLIPGYLTIAAIWSVFNAALPFVNIIASALIIDAIIDRQPLENLYFLSAMTAVVNFCIQIILYLLKRIKSYLSANINWIYEKPLNEKQQVMDFTEIDDPETRLIREKMAVFQSIQGKGLLRLFSLFEGMLENFLTVAFSISIFIPVLSSADTADGFLRFVNTPWFAVLFIFMILGNAFLNMRLTAMRIRKGTDIVSGLHFPQLVSNYFKDKLLSKYQAGKDIKVNQMRDCIIDTAYGIDNTVTIPVLKKYTVIEMRYRILGDISANVLSVLVYIFITVKTVLGHLGVGNIVQFIGGITRFNIGFTGLATNIMEMFVNIEALNLYFEFLDKPAKIHHGSIPVERRNDNKYEIEFCDVSFRYPRSKTYSLKNLNLKIRAGQRMAVVGMNGSGKTTMIKLLCRLYDPTEGKITLNGVNINEYDYNDYTSIFGVVFQDFKLFSFPLGQNVAASIHYDAERVAAYLKKARFSERAAVMPKGLNTPLYKDFDEDGVEVSGGEAQKIAIARALYKDAPFIVLDEPTAALDPIAEFEVYSTFNESIENKTAIFISHRLSSCRFCQDIAVFHEGQLVQRGDHDTLIFDENGKYYELWNAQAQYYVERVV